MDIGCKFYAHKRRYVFSIFVIFTYQVEAAFKRFDQTGNEKLNFKEFSDMMTKRADGGRGESRRARPQQEAGDSAAVSSEPNKD